jgi:hypothetical protein
MTEDTVTLEKPAPSTKGRSIGIVVLVVVATLLCTPALVAYWGQRTLNDTDRFVATMGPLVDQPEVQAAITQQVTTAIQDQVDVEALLTDAFSGVIADRPRIELLVGPIAGAVNSLVENQVRAFVASDAFANLWVRVNTRTQQGLVKVLEGDNTGAISVQGDQIVLDLSDVIETVKAELVDRGLTFAAKVPVPQTDKQIVLLTSAEMQQAQNIYAFTNPVAKWLLWVVLAMFLGAVLLARRKARMTVVTGFCLAGNGLLLMFLLTVGRQVFVNELAGTVFGPASKVFYDILLTYLHAGGRALVTLGLILVASGWFSGSTSSAIATRSTVSGGLETVGNAIKVDQFRAAGRWVVANVRWLRVVAALVAVVVALWGNQVDRERLLWCFVLMLALFAVLQLFVGAGKAPVAEPTEETAPASS